MEEVSDRKPQFTVVGGDPTAETDRPVESDYGELESQLVYIAEAERQALGTTLREAREQRGMPLSEAANELRIRYVFLEAIETGRFNELPGDAYASGFLRSYANYLNLDAEEVIRRFKASGSGFDAKTELAFPVLFPESRIPKGEIVLVSLLVAAMTYGVWYSLSRPDPAIERVSEVPERLTTTGPAGNPLGSPNTEEAPGTDGATPDWAVMDGAAPDVVLPPAPAPSTESPPATPTPATPNPATPNLAAAPTPTAEPPVVGGGARPQGVEFGSTVRSRILLRATKDVWVHIGDSRNGEVFLNRTLKSGESFQVPEGKGLTLMTGNAGAIEIFIDGERAPRLGPPSVIRRLVTLEAERLRMGTAVIR